MSRSLTEIKADVKETREAISAVANDDGALAELCLTERHGDETPWCDGQCLLWLASMTGDKRSTVLPLTSRRRCMHGQPSSGPCPGGFDPRG